MAVAEDMNDEVESEVVGKDDVDGREDALRKVARRIEQVSKSQDVEGGFKIRLYAKTKTGIEELVEAFDYSLDGDADETAQEIVEAAVENLLEKKDELPKSGTITFCIRIPLFDQATNFKLQLLLERPNGTFGEPDPIESTTVGVVQAMTETLGMVAKHADSMAKQNGADFRAVITSLQVQNRNLMAENAELKRTQLEMIRQYEDLVSQNWRRKVEQRRFEREEKKEEERDEMIAAAVKLLGPQLLAQAGVIPPQLAAAASNMFMAQDQQKAEEAQARKATESVRSEAGEWADDFTVLEDALSKIPQDQVLGLFAANLDQATMARTFEVLMKMKERAARHRASRAS